MPANLYWTLLWSLLVLALGCCVGSFLNVVIYRWPRDLSLRDPLWSFCPHCRATLAWYDNLPVLSYIMLGARCRYCRASISRQYPLVELATGLLFVLVYDGLFVARLRQGVHDLGSDWPILLAHWVLVAGLVVVTVMDLEAYIVDIRITWILSGAGLLLHTLWTPATSRYGEGWLRPGAYQAMFAACSAVGLAIGMLLFRRPPEPDAAPEKPAPDTPTEETVSSSGKPEQLTDAHLRPAGGSAGLWTLLPVILVVGYIGFMLYQEYHAFAEMIDPPRDAAGRLMMAVPPAVDPGALRVGVGLAVVFAGLVLFASQPHPEEDQAIVEAIQEEAPDSRRNALNEFRLLIPMLVLVIALTLALSWWPTLDSRLARLLHWQVGGEWQPLLGLATGLAGWAIGGGIAWLTRLIGTLALGKEALGMGDVHIMAAIGAIAGWCVAVLGFFVSSPLALLGILVIHFRRQSRALPYGPWLALGSLIVVFYQDQILRYLRLADLLR